MSVRFNLVLSEELNNEIESVISETEDNKSEVLRKALQLYLAAREGKKHGLKIGLVNAESKMLETEIIGL